MPVGYACSELAPRGARNTRGGKEEILVDIFLRMS